MAAHEGRLELTWTNKRLRLLAHDDGAYEWVEPSDFRVAEVRLLHDGGTVGAPFPAAAWMVEAKMDKEMGSADVRAKREAARRWANHVSADPTTGAICSPPKRTSRPPRAPGPRSRASAASTAPQRFAWGVRVPGSPSPFSACRRGYPTLGIAGVSWWHRGCVRTCGPGAVAGNGRGGRFPVSNPWRNT